MSTKNIILIVVCLVCAYFIFTKLLRLGGGDNIQFDQEKVRCKIVAEWLQKKSITDTCFYGIHDTLSTILEKENIRVNTNIIVKPEKPLDDFFSQVKAAGVKSIIFNESLKTTDAIEGLQAFLKSGGTVYFRSFSIELNENEPLYQSILAAMKKGQVCIVLNKISAEDVRGLSVKKRVLAENDFIDDSNVGAFEKWHQDFVKMRAEFSSKMPPPQ